MKFQVRQKDIRAELTYGTALPLDEARKLVESGQRKYHDFENVCFSLGVYGINGLMIRDTTTGQLYADAARTTNCFMFHRF